MTIAIPVSVWVSSWGTTRLIQRTICQAVLLTILMLPIQFARADLQFDPRSAPADAQRLRDLIAKCEGELQSFRELMDAIRRSSRPVSVFPGRDQPGVFVDRFATDEIDLSDLEKYANPRKDPESRQWIFPPGVDREAATLCENLAHVLYERFHANYVGGRYEPSHDAANSFESRIRREFGQTGSLIDCTGDGHSDDAISIYRNDEFIVERDTITVRPNGSRDVGPISTRKVKVICAGGCPAPPPPAPQTHVRVLAGGDTCEECERELANQCGGRLAFSACRTK